MKRLCNLMLGVCCLALPVMAQNEAVDSAAQIRDDVQQLLINAAADRQYDGQLVFSLSEAQQYAVAHNRSLQNAAIEVKKARAQRWQTIAAMLPQVDASAQYINMFNYKMKFGAGSGTSEDQLTDAQKMDIGKFSMTFPEVSKLLFSNQGPAEITMPDYMTAGVTASIGINGQAIVGALLNTIAIEMQDISREQSESELRAQVMNAYMAVLVVEDVIALMDSSLVNLEKLAAQTERMVEVGAAEQTQADQIRVRVNALKNNVHYNQLSRELAYNSLRVLLDLDANTELTLTSRMEDVLNAEQTLQMLAADFNINNNYNYQLLQKNVDLAKTNVHMAAWAYGPTIGAQYQYQYRKNFQEGGMNMTPPNMVAVSVSMPLWSSGKRAAGVTEKKLALEAARNTLSETTDNLGIQHQQLRYTLANAYETYVNEADNIEVTQRVMQNVVNKYNWGAASMLELTNASNDLISAESNYVQAVLNLVNAYVDLDKFLNNPK